MRITTESGMAQAEIDTGRATPRFLLVLTHGAGGTVQAPDLLAVRAAGLGLGGMVARVTQPYRVRGARAPGAPARQDAAWVEAVAALRKLSGDVPLVQGGRSNGARVACRTAAAVAARAVIALAFPLTPPRRLPAVQARTRARGTGAADGTGNGAATQTRLAELRAARAADAMVLVINGDGDPFGIPSAQDADRVVVVPGETHALRGHQTAISAAVADWLPGALRATVGDESR